MIEKEPSNETRLPDWGFPRPSERGVPGRIAAAARQLAPASGKVENTFLYFFTFFLNFFVKK